MKKTFADFQEVVKAKVNLYAEIPERHLSIEGRNVYELYRAVEFLACFASNAAELLDLMQGDADVEEAARYADSELRKICRALENMAAADNVAA